MISRRFCFSTQPANFFGPISSSNWRVPGGGTCLWSNAGGLINRRQRPFQHPALGLRIAVHDYVAQERQQLGGAVAARLELEQFRRGVDQRRGRPDLAEHRVVDHIFEKRAVRLHSTRMRNSR